MSIQTPSAAYTAPVSEGDLLWFAKDSTISSAIPDNVTINGGGHDLIFTAPIGKKVHIKNARTVKFTCCGERCTIEAAQTILYQNIGACSVLEAPDVSPDSQLKNSHAPERIGFGTAIYSLNSSPDGNEFTVDGKQIKGSEKAAVVNREGMLKIMRHDQPVYIIPLHFWNHGEPGKNLEKITAHLAPIGVKRAPMVIGKAFTADGTPNHIMLDCLYSTSTDHHQILQFEAVMEQFARAPREPLHMPDVVSSPVNQVTKGSLDKTLIDPATREKE